MYKDITYIFIYLDAQYSSINSTASKANLEIICSTPNSKKVYSFNDSPLLSPIKTPIQEENHNLSTDSFCNRDSVLVQNIPKNNIVLDNKQIVAIPKILELSGFEMLNTYFTTNIIKYTKWRHIKHQSE